MSRTASLMVRVVCQSSSWVALEGSAQQMAMSPGRRETILHGRVLPLTDSKVFINVITDVALPVPRL